MNSRELLMSEISSLCERDTNCTVVYDLDGTLLEGDLGETLFYVLLFLRATKKDIEDIPKLEHTIKEKDFINSIASSIEITLLRAYLILLDRKKYNEAYALSSFFIESFSDEEIQRASELTINAFSTQIIELWLDTYRFILYVKQDTLIYSTISSLSKNLNCSVYIVSALLNLW